MPGPGRALFDAIRSSVGDLPVVAEDLGFITPEVEELRKAIGVPGMKILQFAFAKVNSPHLPHMYDPMTVVYTGTHDNDTTRGWYAAASEHEQDHLRRYLGTDVDHVAQDLTRVALSSIANTAIVPLQDVLDLGSEARMNTPGSAESNWSWRFLTDQLEEREHSSLPHIGRR